MSHKDWLRIRRRIEHMTNPIAWAGNLAWTCVGIAIGAVFAFVPWLAAHSEMSDANKAAFAWVTPAMIAVFAASAILAAMGFLFDRAWRSHAKHDAALVIDDMDAVYEPHGRVTQPSAASQ